MVREARIESEDRKQTVSSLEDGVKDLSVLNVARAADFLAINFDRDLSQESLCAKDTESGGLLVTVGAISDYAETLKASMMQLRASF